MARYKFRHTCHCSSPLVPLVTGPSPIGNDKFSSILYFVLKILSTFLLLLWPFCCWPPQPNSQGLSCSRLSPLSKDCWKRQHLKGKIKVCSIRDQQTNRPTKILENLSCSEICLFQASQAWLNLLPYSSNLFCWTRKLKSARFVPAWAWWDHVEYQRNVRWICAGIDSEITARIRTRCQERYLSFNLKTPSSRVQLFFW